MSENYAIIELAGHQYKVSPNRDLIVESLNAETGELLNPKVLLYKKGNEVKIGRPYLDNVKVHLKVLEKFKGKKIRGFKYRPKKRYRRRWGFRPILARVKVLSIEETM